MTEPAAPPEISAFAPDDPRRLVLADLVAQLAAGLAEREAAYDRASDVGRLDRALEAAPKRGWTVASMRRDWKTVFPR